MASWLAQRRYILLWQVLLLILGTSWLWAPHLNHVLSYRTSLISQYESPIQPFSWLFRIGDVAAGALLLAMALVFMQSESKKIAARLLLIISAGIILDPVLSTSCNMVGDACKEYVSFSFVLHAIETTVTSSAIFALAVYDSWNRKKAVSILFSIFQFAYGLLFVSQLADHDRFNTVSQYVYQTAIIVWLAWFCRDVLSESRYSTAPAEQRITKNLVAGWAFLNGVVAIVISLAHINLLGRIRGLYFTGDSAWLAQHGIIVGVIMLYLSRHLARGEARARQIFLLLSGIETIKYAVLSPHSGLMLFYMLTFIILFILRDNFDRGSVPLTWSLRFRDLYFLVSGLLVSALISLSLLDRDNRVSIITNRAANHFTDYVTRGRGFPARHINSILLAHSISVFLTASLFAVLWILFRPYKVGVRRPKDYKRAELALSRHSSSSEDFFKLWPRDKEFFWNRRHNGFIAYKIAGPVAFALADPITTRKKQLADNFNIWCRGHRLKVCYLPIYADSLPLYEGAGLIALQIGSSAVIDIDNFLSETVKDKWWRWRINKAEKSNYTYSIAMPPHPKVFLDQLKKVSDAWLNSGGHAERGFALGYFDKKYLQKCRIHYLNDESGKVVAFTNEVPLFSDGPIRTIDLLRHTPETDAMAYLLYRTIQTIEGDGGLKFDLGFVPFAKARGPLLSITKAVATDRFSAKGLEQFKNKFRPSWEPNYLAYEGDIADLAVIALNIEKAMEPAPEKS